MQFYLDIQQIFSMTAAVMAGDANYDPGECNNFVTFCRKKFNC